MPIQTQSDNFLRPPSYYPPDQAQITHAHEDISRLANDKDSDTLVCLAIVFRLYSDIWETTATYNNKNPLSGVSAYEQLYDRAISLAKEIGNVTIFEAQHGSV